MTVVVAPLVRALDNDLPADVQGRADEFSESLNKFKSQDDITVSFLNNYLGDFESKSKEYKLQNNASSGAFSSIGWTALLSGTLFGVIGLIGNFKPLKYIGSGLLLFGGVMNAIDHFRIKNILKGNPEQSNLAHVVTEIKNLKDVIDNKDYQ